MPPKRKSAGRKGQKGQKGRGIKEVASAAKDFVVDNKLISKTLGMIPHPIAQAASSVASVIGLGKPKQHGGGIFTDAGMGVGSALAGLGSGIGSVFHGVFGGAPATTHHMSLAMPDVNRIL